MIYGGFESILVPKDNGKQIPNEKKLAACSYGYKLVPADDEFSQPFKC